MNKNKQENNNILFGRQEGSKITERGFWACLSETSNKGEKFWLAGSNSLRGNK